MIIGLVKRMQINFYWISQRLIIRLECTLDHSWCGGGVVQWLRVWSVQARHTCTVFPQVQTTPLIVPASQFVTVIGTAPPVVTAHSCGYNSCSLYYASILPWLQSGSCWMVKHTPVDIAIACTAIACTCTKWVHTSAMPSSKSSEPLDHVRLTGLGLGPPDLPDPWPESHQTHKPQSCLTLA